MVELYDTTLRDGSQGEDISFTVEDKLRIAEKLDEFCIHYIEAGWPGSNPKDDEFFKSVGAAPRGRPVLSLRRSKLVAFGSTRRRGIKADQDKHLAALLKAKTPVITIFGKSWDLHVREALHASPEENLEIIFDSVQFLKKNVSEVIYDAEHFFDGYKADPQYALKTIQAAREAGADRIVLCDTNGGTLPSEIYRIVSAVGATHRGCPDSGGHGGPPLPLGIHCHNDSECAVANSLAAVEAGATQIHGTINGIGERCGNANLISIIPNLKLKMGISCVSDEKLRNLRILSRFIDELSNRIPPNNQPYVGRSAFAHKGGVHVSAILKNRATYEHIDPEMIGNRQRVLVSDLSGQSNVVFKTREFGIELNAKDPALKKIVNEVKELENQGYQFEGAEASFEILIQRALKKYKPFFRLIHFQVVDQMNKSGKQPKAVAKVEIEVAGKRAKTVAEGHGPINALDQALRKALVRFYPGIKEVQLVDYKVRVLPAGKGTASQVRVLIESRDKTTRWGTVGVSENIIQASWQALVDSLEYKLMK